MTANLGITQTGKMKMNNYKPDYFTVVEFKTVDKPTTYKVFATWIGGFTRGDSWRLSTEVARVEAKGQLLYFYGRSGSCYEVHKDTWGTTIWSGAILDGIVEKFNLSGVTTAEVLDRNTDWLSLEYT